MILNKIYNRRFGISVFVSFNLISSTLPLTSFGKDFDNSNLKSRTIQNKDITRSPSSNGNKSPHNYCIAIRGNGELMPAHWGGLAQTVENFGVPKGMAGGSSGSISTFFMESYLMNPILTNKELDEKTKAAYLAFMIKSMQGFIYNYTSKERFQHFFDTIKMLVDLENKGNSFPQRFANFFVKYKNPVEVFQVLDNVRSLLTEAKNSKVFYGPQVKSFDQALQSIENDKYTLLMKVKFNMNLTKEESVLADKFKSEYSKLKEGLTVFGSFNAKNDKTLFYRGGIINFSELAEIFGFIADFYSLNNASDTTKNKFTDLLKTCALAMSGKSWGELNPALRCQEKLNDSISSFAADLKNPDENVAPKPSRIQQLVGTHFPALISTSVVINNPNNITEVYNTSSQSNISMGSADLLKFKKSEYDSKTSEELQDKNYLNSLEYLPIHVEDIKFGYWGKHEDLIKEQAFINSHHEDPEFSEIVNSEKTSRFLALGEASWKTVLSLSPAEPGLSSLLPFNSDGKDYVSLGGWSDLLPIPALKYMGCENVVYVTRQGGESLFAQGVAKRIFRFDEIEWKDLDPSESTPNNLTQYYNNVGRNVDDETIKAGRWTKMFNLANPKSSFNLSLEKADAVVCTHWNSFDVKKNFKEMIKEAYEAPIYNPSNLQFLGLKTDNKVITKDDNTMAANLIKGFKIPQYAGCIPNY